MRYKSEEFGDEKRFSGKDLKEDFETIKNQYDKLLKKYKLNE